MVVVALYLQAVHMSEIWSPIVSDMSGRFPTYEGANIPLCDGCTSASGYDVGTLKQVKAYL